MRRLDMQPRLLLRNPKRRLHRDIGIERDRVDVSRKASRLNPIEALRYE